MGNKTKSNKIRYQLVDKSTGGPAVLYEIDLVMNYNRVGQDDRAFRSKIKNGLSAVNPLTVDARLADHRSVRIHGRIRASILHPWVDIFVDNPAYFPTFNTTSYGSLVTKAENVAAMKFFKKLRSTQREIQGGVFLGELRETILLLKRPAAALRDFTLIWSEYARKLRATLKGKVLRKALAASYLEWQFAVKPLLSDTADAARALSKILHKFETTKCNVFHSEEQLGATINTPESRGFFLLSRGITDNATVEVFIKAGIRAKVAPDDVESTSSKCQRILDTLGFNLSEFIPTVWNVLPTSFITDYFSNVGAVLEAATTFLGDLVYYCRTVVYQRTRTCAVKCFTRIASFIDVPEQSGGGYTSKHTTVVRSAGVTYPRFAFSLPKVGQVANLAALFLAIKR